jgi:hypothetical protein
VFVEMNHSDVRTLPSEMQRGGATDAAVAVGHDRGLAL